MKLGILGTGNVGQTLGTRCVELGHEVTLGSRTADNEAAVAWASDTGAHHGTFADAVASAELVINATSGIASLAALTSTGDGALDGKIILDVANALDFSKGFPPTLAICNDDSLGEQIQREYPAAHVVKSLNTVNCDVMVHPDRVSGVHSMFVAGNDEPAKAVVMSLLHGFGWQEDALIDLGDITAARAMEMYLPLWLRLFGTIGDADFNINVVSARRGTSSTSR